MAARILIIDDTKAIHDDFRKILERVAPNRLDETEQALFGHRPASPERARFELDSAYQGQEGLALVQQAIAERKPYAVAFVDVRMPPGWDGIETITQLWAVEPDLQVVVCTAHSDYSWADISERIGARDNLLILKKPFDNVEVLQLVHALAQKWHLTQAAKRRLDDLDSLIHQRTREVEAANEKLLQEVVERKQAQERILRLNRLYSILSKINELIVRTRSIELLYQEACRIAVEEGGFRLAWIGSAEPGTLRIKPVAYCGLEEAYVRNVHVSADAAVPEGLGPAGTALRQGTHDVCNDVTQDPRMQAWRELVLQYRFRSIGAFPLKNKGHVVAVLTLYSPEPDFFNAEEIGLLEQLSADLSFALEFLDQKQQLYLQGAALEAAANSIVVTDPAGVILWHNEAFTRLTGYEFEEAVGQNANLLKSGQQSAEFYANLWRTIRAGEPWRGEIINRRKDGSLYPEEMTITPVRGDNQAITHYVAIKQEVTERKRAEQRLTAFSTLGQRLCSAQSAKQAAQIIVEVADRLLGWDACSFALYSPEEDLLEDVLSADVINGQRCYAPDPAPTYHQRPPSVIVRRALVEGQLVLRTRPEGMLAEGVPFGDTARPSASLLFVPIRNGTHVIGILSIQSYQPNAYSQHSLETLQALADHCGGVLDRLKAEQALRAAQEQLRQSQKMEAIGQLAGGVAHDFNNLLAVIRGNTELALMEAGQFRAQTRDCLTQVTAAADRAANLTRQLLAFSRKQVMQVQPLNLNDVMGNLTKMLKRIIGEDVQLQCSYAARLPLVEADIGMIEQVLVNLVVNARDAMPHGGQLLVTTEEATLDRTAALLHPERHPGHFSCLSVTDTGDGIAPEHLTRIFEPFFTTKQPGKGTGLGLATVYGIIQQHAGWIEVASELGVGSTFKIFLPASSAPPAEAPRPRTTVPKPKGGHETILLVEDDEAVRSLTRLVLHSFGYDVREAACGPEALELWATHGAEIDLLLTDMIMPHGLTGRDLAERLRSQRPDLKIIFMSGYSGDVAGSEADLLQGRDWRFLQKPCPTQELLQAVRQCLDGQLPSCTSSHSSQSAIVGDCN